MSDASSLVKQLTCGCADANAAAVALSQAVAQSGCSGTAVAEAFAEAVARGQVEAFINGLASAKAENVLSCVLNIDDQDYGEDYGCEEVDDSGGCL